MPTPDWFTTAYGSFISLNDFERVPYGRSPSYDVVPFAVIPPKRGKRKSKRDKADLVDINGIRISGDCDVVKYPIDHTPRIVKK